MDQNGSQTRLQKITDELAEEVHAAQERAERAKGVWELAKAESQHVSAALKALDPEHKLVQSTAKPTKGKKSSPPSQEVMDLVEGWLRDRVQLSPDEGFTVRQVAEGLKATSTDDPIRRAIYYLRDQELLRAAGKVKVGDHGQPAMQFKVMDKAAFGG